MTHLQYTISSYFFQLCDRQSEIVLGFQNLFDLCIQYCFATVCFYGSFAYLPLHFICPAVCPFILQIVAVILALIVSKLIIMLYHLRRLFRNAFYMQIPFWDEPSELPVAHTGSDAGLRRKSGLGPAQRPSGPVRR